MKSHNSGFLGLVAATRERVQETTVDEVQAMQAADHAFHLVDVREDREWEQEHIPGAIHLGKGVIERDIEKTIPDVDAHIVLYCGGGYRSVLAADALQQMGYTNVWSLAGGYSGWKEAGYSVTAE